MQAMERVGHLFTRVHHHFTDKQLPDYVADGDWNQVKKLLLVGVNPNYTNNRGSALCLAIMYGRLEIAELLLQYGANPNPKEPILENAVFKEYPAFAHLLLAYGANPNNENERRITPFQHVVADQNVDLCELMLKFGANSSGAKALYDNLKKEKIIKKTSNNMKEIDRLLEQNRQRLLINKPTATHWHNALQEGDLSAIQQYIKFGLIPKDEDLKNLKIYYLQQLKQAYAKEFVKTVNSDDQYYAHARFQKVETINHATIKKIALLSLGHYRATARQLLKYLRLIGPYGTHKQGPISKTGIDKGKIPLDIIRYIAWLAAR